MVKSKKIFLTIILLFFFAASVFAQQILQPWWLSLEQGKILFRQGNYGGALLLFEDARRDRRTVYEQMERDLISLLSINEVRRIGDYLDRVERFSRDRYYTRATAALEELYYRIPKESLKNSANAALEALGKLKDYPEAEYWIGEVFRIEGELTLALAQYNRAYSMREVLEDLSFSTALRYKIADIHRIRQDYNEMERGLLSIINEFDNLWINARQADALPGNATNVPYAQASASFVSQSMTRILENEGVNRFLEMYRYNNRTVEQAHRFLGFHYAVTGRPSAQQHLMYSFLIQSSIIIEEVTRKQFDFAFTTLTALVNEANRNPLLTAFMEEAEYYKTVYYLGASLYRNGKAASARSLWEFLAAVPQAGEWQSRSIVQLRTPHMEPIVEMP